MTNVIRKILMILVTACFLVVNGTQIAKADNSKLSREYVDAYFTALAAASCFGTYFDNGSVEYNYLRSLGWSIEPQVSHMGKLETHYTVARRYFSDIDKEVFIVTFRGSTTKMDWKINLKTKKVNYGGTTLKEIEEVSNLPFDKNGALVHGGFNEYAINVLKDSVIGEGDILRGVFGYAEEKENAHVILTGHSMGGAVATLVATRLVDLGFPKDKLHVLTFGAPAIGNEVYNEKFANGLDILRITNTNDPIPGSLQTFFSGYIQCGRNKKYHLSAQIGNLQHDMAMYFDHSIIDLYKVEDEEIAAGRMNRTARNKVTAGVPTVAIWVMKAPGLGKMPSMPDLKRLLVEQYARMFPSYILMNDQVENGPGVLQNDIITDSARAGADYILVCGIDGKRQKEREYSWFLVQDQAIFNRDGQMLSMTSFAKRVVPAIGNVQAAGENSLEAFKEIRKALPFVTGPRGNIR